MRFILLNQLCINVDHIVSIEGTKEGFVIRTTNRVHIMSGEFGDFMYQFMNGKSAIHLTDSCFGTTKG